MNRTHANTVGCECLSVHGQLLTRALAGVGLHLLLPRRWSSPEGMKTKMKTKTKTEEAAYYLHTL